SLERQIVALYDGLVGRTLGQALAGDDRPRAAADLAQADVELDDAREHPAVARLGKRIHKLRTKLSNPKVVSPALRLSLRRAEPMPTAEETGEDDDAIVSGGAPPLPEPAAVPTTPAPASPPTPEQALLAELDAELHWARARHGSLLDELGLVTMTIGEAPGQGITSLGPKGIVVRRDHPIVARLLQQQTFDPFDLAFVLVGVYALLNDRHERIADDDERAFVHQLAETLVMVTRR